MVSGILTQENGASLILDESGVRHFENRTIWDGYFPIGLGKKYMRGNWSNEIMIPMNRYSYSGRTKKNRMNRLLISIIMKDLSNISHLFWDIPLSI